MADVLTILAAIDIGAGLGTKISLATPEDFHTRSLADVVLTRQEYGTTSGQYIDQLVSTLKKMMADCELDFSALSAIGVSIPGFAGDDQKIIACNNLPLLDGVNIVAPLSKACDATVAIMNDGDCGALAQWKIDNQELFYWAFGGGWGGSWISAAGNIRFPTINWDGQDRHIHLANEPGYVSRISKEKLESLFVEYDVSWRIFRENFSTENSGALQDLHGPDNDSSSVRGETCVSGNGLWRLYHARAKKPDLSRFSDARRSQLLDQANGAECIFQLVREGDAAATSTVALFSRILGEVGVDILKVAIDDGAPVNIPIYLGGGIAKSFELFAPEAQKVIQQAGMQSLLVPGHFVKSGLNANLIGAFCLAAKNTFMLENM